MKPLFISYAWSDAFILILTYLNLQKFIFNQSCVGWLKWIKTPSLNEEIYEGHLNSSRPDIISDSTVKYLRCNTKRHLSYYDVISVSN